MRSVSTLLTILLLVSAAPLRARAQARQFSLADARAGESYSQSLPRTLREKYDLSVASGSRRSGLKWVAAGRLPAGLELDRASGVLSGTPDDWQEAPYKLRFKVSDAASPDSEPLELTFTLKILPPRVQLVRSDAVRLVPASVQQTRPAQRGGRSSRGANRDTPRGDGEQPNGRSRRATSDEDEPSGDEQDEEEAEEEKCKEVEIVSINNPKKDNLDIEVVVGDDAVTALDIFVRGDKGTSPIKRVPVTRKKGEDSATVSEEVKLSSGDNTISVFGLDNKLKTVGSCEKTLTFSGTPSTPREAAAPAETPLPILSPGPISLSPTKRTVKKSELKSDPAGGNFKLKSLLFGEKGKDVTAFYVRVLDGSGNVVDEGPQTLDAAATKPASGGRLTTLPVTLGAGNNTVTVLAIGAANKPLGEDTIDIFCEDCDPRDVSGGPRLRVESPFAVSDQPDAPVRITVIQPVVDDKLTGEEKQKAEQEAQRQKIKEIHYQVSNADDEVFDHGDVGVAENSKVQPVVVGLREGTNTVMFFGRDSAGQKNTPDSVTRVECRNCVGASSRVGGNSIYTRAIVGFEQAGGSGSDSTQKPFLDFFFGAPVGRRAREVTPRVTLWGNARFASLPLKSADTTNTLSGLASGSVFLDAVSGLQRNEAVQSFDFQAGVDVRIVPQNDRGYMSLIPGTRQRTSLSLIASFGAISPLSADTTAPKLFAVPKDANGDTDPSFLKLFPGSEKKDVVAFVVPNRDRFYRQYYGGVRVKTFFYDRHNQIINRFPAMIDFTLGQNEAVTGNLHGSVFRLEGFYPFPFREASFFYLYGTAMMKLGGNEERNPLPLFLKDAPDGSDITSTKTLIVPVDTNPNLRRTRDSYRLGVGIDLIELLNKLRAPVQPRP